jgi:hypothetical protein
MTLTGWRKSSYSGGSGQGSCVELIVAPSVTHVRDTKNRAGGKLTVPAPSWSTFVSFVGHQHRMI